MSKKVSYLVEKSNMLNTLQSADMSLTELRFFCLYLSRLNARNPGQRTVDIPVSEFEHMFDTKINTTIFNSKIMTIATRGIKILENGKIKVLTLYSEFCWSEFNPNTITITCNDKMLPYIFELKKNYTTYIIENISKLNSVQKIRLYEIVKQYEKIGNIKIDLEELQKMMCCNTSPIFKDFKKNTLTPAIKAINKHTDIELSYEKILKCRKVVALKLIIKRKENKGPTMIEEPKPIIAEQTYLSEIEILYHKCNEEYTLEQLQNIMNIVISSNILEVTKNTAPNYIFNVYSRIKASGQEVHNMYKYTLGVISKDTEHSDEKNRLQEVSKSKKDASYDLEEYKNFIRTTKRNMGG